MKPPTIYIHLFVPKWFIKYQAVMAIANVDGNGSQIIFQLLWMAMLIIYLLSNGKWFIRYQIPSGVIKHGWQRKIPELNGGF